MKILNSPTKIFFLGSIFCLVYVLFDGTLWHYWTLQKSSENLNTQIMQLKKEAESLKFNIERSQASSYIERQATESLALVREGDLVFIFSE